MKKRNDIIQAAERLFYASGFHATSTDQICRAAGVSTRTLYHHFSSREALTAAVMDAREQRFMADLWMPQQPEAIARLFQVLGEWTQANGAKGCFFLKAWGEYAERDAALAAQALAFRATLRRYISDCVTAARGEEQPLLSDAIWMLFEGAITSALVIGPVAAQQAGTVASQLLQQHGAAQ
ncbi:MULTISPECIES: TetR/AcrR family transcriptional regulator [Pantoea]|jgi:AcrR family transcriptional regulator|uniref:TetR/AcrR family transcriptional regulator n=1 Tax=Pantoea brenneri TaxID=472694 RepID=A0A7Y6NAT6_9GAMM|nr:MULTISPECIES: TetR/AcrR family transcriptional regulator [Pantoea]MBZ6393456.1 TetR/AcrR family transcriptional regulator [Pantoea sp.]MBZ6437561.1 TetR/AcrR family transcriptional regulator [Pantoea sp.]MDU4126226.1 TetR/AcrR family transcriptional regulator [Pantoea sp.]NUY40186.1 TetR/AcrR family transcriptional regulator [Pantoea brenneri]NUY47730.1 TetR/AcrR family transcriptional regulator [Pantoea brenneri]